MLSTLSTWIEYSYFVMMTIVLSLSTFLVFRLIYRAYRTAMAQRELEKLVRKRHKKATLQRLSAVLAKDPLDQGHLSEAMELLQQELIHFGKEDQQKLRTGLCQPSFRGRANFAANVLEKSANMELS
jgi:hypothetical protein